MNIRIIEGKIINISLIEVASDNQAEKTIACPNCAVPLTINDDGAVVQEVTQPKRKGLKVDGEKGKTMKV
jgi:hypothetical protein